MGHLGQGAREGAGRRRDMMLQEERGRRGAEAYFMAYIRGRVRGSQTREKKPRTPPHVMKGDQARSLVPITITGSTPPDLTVGICENFSTFPIEYDSLILKTHFT